MENECTRKMFHECNKRDLKKSITQKEYIFWEFFLDVNISKYLFQPILCLL